MLKFIAALDGLKLSASTIAYSIDLAKKSNALLVGVFLDDEAYTGYKIYNLLGPDGIVPEKLKALEDKDKSARKQASERFQKACRDAGISYQVHHDRKMALQELLHESIYADLLVIDGRETLTHYEEKAPTRFIHHLLTEVQCPVLVVPPKFKPVNKLVFLYDGGPSSVYALKMLSYFLPPLNELETEVLTVKTPKQTMKVPDTALMKELMKRRFPRAGFTVLKGIPETEIIRHCKECKGNALVITGAYRRGAVSRWFRHSFADSLMAALKLPLFIAHYK